MKTKSTVFIMCFLVVSYALFAQGSERRIALVIGNSEYKSSPLKNPVNDARDISLALGELGFAVTTKLNSSEREMFEAVRDFGNELVHSDVGMFFYAGYAVAVGGINYLIPVDANIQAEDEVPFTSINAGLVLSKMESAGNGTNIVILDSCRDNPLYKRFRSSSRGLAVMQARSGSLVIYATAPGSVTADGKGRNGIFTGALLRHIKTPGVEIEQVLKKVKRDVALETGNEQIPWFASSLTRSFYLTGMSGTVAAKPEEEGSSTFTVKTACGNVKIEVETGGNLYLDGTRQGRLPAGGSATLNDLETGIYSLEMRYDDGKKETKSVTVLNGKAVEVVFSNVEQPAVPEGFVLVEAGSFRMGSESGDSNEKPVHTVIISKAFYLSKYQVTQKQWQEVMGSNPSYLKGDNLPVETVSWHDAVEYCNRLSRREGLTPCYSGSDDTIRCDFSADGYRLPTEAEWEYAARGGKRANELGLYDMNGNFWEWCWDWYDSGYYASSPLLDPRGPSLGSHRVARSGGWSRGAGGPRAVRYDHTPSGRDSLAVGIRLARTV